MIFLEGYISESTIITITARYNYLGGQETKTCTFAGTESDYIIATGDYNVLGDDPIGLEPLGAQVSDEVQTDLQKFRVYLTTTKTPFYELSLEVKSTAAGSQWEILRIGTNTGLLSQPVTKLKKALS
jgi:hypothetical protein